MKDKRVREKEIGRSNLKVPENAKEKEREKRLIGLRVSERVPQLRR